MEIIIESFKKDKKEKGGVDKGDDKINFAFFIILIVNT